MYAIVKTGGKQYRVQPGQSLLVERLPVADGETFTLPTLLYVDGSDLVDGDGLANVTVEAKVLAHERGPKLRIVKFKPKRGYKRRNGHRQELTRIEVTSMAKTAAGGRKASARSSVASSSAPSTSTSPAPVSAASTTDEPTPLEATDGA